MNTDNLKNGEPVNTDNLEMWGGSDSVDSYSLEKAELINPPAGAHGQVHTHPMLDLRTL